MKIRMGFVSNSSSTSFCVIGMPIKEDIYSGKFKWEPNIMMIGGWCDDGDYVIDLTEDKYDILANSITTPACKGHVDFFRKAVFYETDGSLEMHGKGARLKCGSCTINVPEVEDFESMYIKGEGIEF